MRETNDGFRIAEEDLRLRGPGEMLGTKPVGRRDIPGRGARGRRRLAPVAQGDARLLLDRDGGLVSERGGGGADVPLSLRTRPGDRG